jgi:cellulose biosynthesis protein BcsQ
LLGSMSLPHATAGLHMVIIDTPPGLSSLDSLVEAELLLVPVLPEYQGVANLVKYLRLIEGHRIAISPHLRLLALLPSMVERNTIHRDMLEAIHTIAANHSPQLRVLSSVPKRTRIARYDLSAPEYDQPLQEVFDALEAEGR